MGGKPSDVGHNTERLIAFDPGKDTGVAVIHTNKRRLISLDWEIVRGLNELMSYLNNLKTSDYDLVVMEKYRLYRHLALQQSGSTMEVAQAEGMIKLWANQKLPLYVQPANILPIAVKYTKMPLPKNHKNSHGVAALNHGYYWLVKYGLIGVIGNGKD